MIHYPLSTLARAEAKLWSAINYLSDGFWDANRQAYLNNPTPLHNMIGWEEFRKATLILRNRIAQIRHDRSERE